MCKLRHVKRRAVSADRSYRIRLVAQRGILDGMELVFGSGETFSLRKVVVATLPDRP